MGKVIAECSLADLVESPVEDPLVGLLMKSDCVDRRSVELLFERVAWERAGDLEGNRSRLPNEEGTRCSAC
jgi:hypothetical protein